MAQPIAQGDGFAGRIYISDGDGREQHTADILITASDTEDTVSGSATISWANLNGVTASAGSAGVTFTPV